MQAVIPRPDVAPLLQEHFVALAADCDNPESEVEDLAMKVPDAMMLPFVILCDSNGQYVDGHSGAMSPEGLRSMLQRAIG